jgi:hypothetical protein
MPAVLAPPAAPMITHAGPGWADAAKEATLASMWPGTSAPPALI